MVQVNIATVHPAVYQAMKDFSNRAAAAVIDSGLDSKLIELVKIRASQLNGCAFCLKMHTADAVKQGETVDRLGVLPAWWESQYFTESERAALQLTERVTLISDRGTFADRGVDLDHLTQSQVAAVTWLAIVINSWNRIAISSHYPVSPSS